MKNKCPCVKSEERRITKAVVFSIFCKQRMTEYEYVPVENRLVKGHLNEPNGAFWDWCCSPPLYKPLQFVG